MKILILRRYAMEPRLAWHEDDSFWKIWEPWMFTQQRIADAKDDVDGVIKLIKIGPEAHILDLCCGVGRHSLEFARRGYRVTGVDRTKVYLDKARKQAKEEGLDIEFVQGDMRFFSRPNTFNVVINMFTSFSYFEDPQEDKRVVENVFESLKPGGRFIIQMHGKETLAKIFRERDWYENNNLGVIVLQERKVSHNWSWMENRWIMLKGDERIENKVCHRLYAGSELVTLLRDCGFSQVDLYGDLDGNPFDQTARQLVAVGYK
jgi:SAM-dependent methyltransferase